MAADTAIILTDSGETVEAMAPVIVSASRSTDIPAFYAKWFFIAHDPETVLSAEMTSAQRSEIVDGLLKMQAA